MSPYSGTDRGNAGVFNYLRLTRKSATVPTTSVRPKYQPRHHVALASVGVLLGVVGMAVADVSTTSTYASASTLTTAEAAVLGSDSGSWGLVNPVNPVSGESVPDSLPGEAVDAESDSDLIAALQLRLYWDGSLASAPTGEWDAQTTAAVKHFQQKHNHGKGNGIADVATVRKLIAIAGNGSLDSRCLTDGTVLCLDKDQKMIRYVKDGVVIRQFDMNIGPEKGDPNYGRYSSTRLGVFKIGNKQELSVSSLYGYAMPYWMQFDKGIGFHFSKYFGEIGYKDSSMGCTTIAKESDAKWLYDNTPLKTKVVVY